MVMAHKISALAPLAFTALYAPGLHQPSAHFTRSKHSHIMMLFPQKKKGLQNKNLNDQRKIHVGMDQNPGT